MTLDELRAALCPLMERQTDTWNQAAPAQHARRCRVSTDQRNSAVMIYECSCGIGALIAFVEGEEPSGEQ